MNKSVLLTGGAGFLGARVTARLMEQGYAAHLLVRKETDKDYLAYTGALSGAHLHVLADDYSGLQSVIEEVRPTVVVHLASKSRGGEADAEIEEYISSNILFPSLLLNAMSRSGCEAFINCGSSWQWGEDGSYRPFNFYAASKEAFEALLKHYACGGMRSVTLRMFDMYGCGDKRAKVIDLIMKATLSGEALGMTMGQQQIDLVHVDDAASAVCAAVSEVESLGPGDQRVYGVSGGQRVTIRELAQLVGELTNRPVPIEWGKRPYRPREIMEPYSGFPSLPGWSPKRKLEAGLREVLEMNFQSTKVAR